MQPQCEQGSTNELQYERFFVVGGTIDPDAPSYLRRVADDELFEALRAAEYVYVLDSRQKGKSSLIAAATSRLEQTGVQVVRIDLQAIGSNVTPDQWYATLLHQFGKQLGQARELLDHWAANESLGPLARWAGALEEIVLRKSIQPLVVVIDEIDFIRSLPFSTDEFFAGIREFYNRRTSDPVFRGICFCLVGSATPSQLVKQVEITPFNIAREICLQDFTLQDLCPYAEAFGDKQRGMALLSRIHYWTDGHPYLTQAVCRKVASERAGMTRRNVDRVVSDMLLTAEAQQQNQNLLDTSRRILEARRPGVSLDEARARMLFAYSQILSGRRVEADDANWWLAALRLSGAVKLESRLLVPRNRIYRTVFDEKWIAANMPDAELRRQKAAVRRASIRIISLACGVLAVMAGLAAALWQQSNQRQAALLQTRMLKAEVDRQAYNAQMYVLSVRAGNDDWSGAGEILKKTERSPARGWEWDYWNGLLNRYQSSVRAPANQSDIVYGPDGALLLLGNAGIAGFAGQKVTPRRVNIPGFNQQAIGALRSYLTANPMSSGSKATFGQMLDGRIPILISADGRLVVRQDARLDRWLYRPGAKPIRLGLMPFSAVKFHTVDFSPDQSKLAVAERGNTILVSSSLGTKLWSPNPPEPSLYCRFSPDGSLLALGTSDGVVRLIQASNGKRMRELGDRRGLVITSVAFSRDGGWLAAGGADGSIRLWTKPIWEKVITLQAPEGPVTSLTFSPDGSQLASYSAVGELRIWGIPPPQASELISIHQKEVQSAKVSPDGTRLVTSSRDGTVALLEFPSRRVIGTYVYEVPKGDHASSFSPSGRLLAVAKPSGPILLLDANTGQTIRILRGHRSEAYDVRFSFDESRLVTASEDGTTRIWSVENGGLIRELRGDSPFATAAFSPDGRFVLTASKEGTARLWDASTGQAIRTWKLSGLLRTAEFSPDGKRIVAAGSGPVRVFSINRSVPEMILAGHSGTVYRARFSPDGKRILSYSFDRTARLWDAATGKPIAVLRHGGWVASANFSPDGSRIVTGAADNLVRVWDGFTGEELAQLQGHTKAAFDTVWTPDGRSIVSASSDGTVRVWNSRPGSQAGGPINSFGTK